MRGFLARAGHALGRFIVSLGYGGEQEVVGSPGPPVICFQTTPGVFEIEIEAVGFSLGTEPMASMFTSDLMTVVLETEPMVFGFEGEPFNFALETEPDDCSIEGGLNVC